MVSQKPYSPKIKHFSDGPCLCDIAPSISHFVTSQEFDAPDFGGGSGGGGTTSGGGSTGGTSTSGGSTSGGTSSGSVNKNFVDLTQDRLEIIKGLGDYAIPDPNIFNRNISDREGLAAKAYLVKLVAPYNLYHDTNLFSQVKPTTFHCRWIPEIKGNITDLDKYYLSVLLKKASQEVPLPQNVMMNGYLYPIKSFLCYAGQVNAVNGQKGVMSNWVVEMWRQVDNLKNNNKKAGGDFGLQVWRNFLSVLQGPAVIIDAAKKAQAAMKREELRDQQSDEGEQDRERYVEEVKNAQEEQKKQQLAQSNDTGDKLLGSTAFDKKKLIITAVASIVAIIVMIIVIKKPM